MRIEQRIEIDAPRALVWEVTTDVERWPQWTPMATSIKRLDEGPFRVGSAALIRQPGLPEARWEVTELKSGERFSWEARVRGMHMIGTHELEATDSGTASLLRVEAGGVVALLLSPLLRPAVRRSLARENAGLKRECEARERG